ncbi:tetratricopeptide repeat protein [Streptomyces goshikiensis]|uniref:tetratricopeptide repeat protein n=1 Tax=Streptomyces goshikiensis TaxID=1942 RepID=UPI00364EA653
MNPDIYIHASSGGLAIGSIHNLHAPQTPRASWPHQLGVVPLEAHCFEPRFTLDLASAEPTQILVGMGGVGKTQLAAHFARSVQCSRGNDLLVWVSAANRESIELAYAQGAREICGLTEESPPKAAKRFLTWLQTTERHCLIILDDVTDPADMRGLWPPSRPNCRVIVTTRRRDSALLGQGRKLVDVGVFAEQESVSYLARKLGTDGRDCEGEMLGLAADLGHLPLALAQAASYIVDQGLKVSRYRELLKDRRKVLAELVPDGSTLPDDHEDVLAAVWDLSIARADQLWPEGISRYLLALSSMLEPNGIPADVLTSKPARSYLGICKRLLHELDGPLEGDTPDLTEDEVLASLRSLHRLSLVSHSPHEEHAMVLVHPLVQRVARESVDEVHRGELAHFASLSILWAWPRGEGHRELCQILRSSIDRLSAVAFDAVWNVGAYDILFHCADSYGDAGMYSTAISQWTKLRETATSILGPEHPDTLKCLSRLGSWQSKNSDVDNAVDSLLQAFTALKKVKGPRHHETLLTQGELAQMMGFNGGYRGAVHVFEEILESLLIDHDPTHIQVIDTRCQIAHWRAMDGDLSGGIRALEEILEGLPPWIDSESPFTCTIRHNLAGLRAEAGDIAGAIVDLEDLIQVERSTLGPNHPEVLVTQHSLAYFHDRAGNRDRAISETKAVLALREEVLGLEHPKTENTRRLLSRLVSRGAAAE